MVLISIIVNGNKVNISLHSCRAGKTTDNRAICMEEKELNGIKVLRSNCCDYVGNITEQTDFVSMGKAYHDTKKLVLNYLSNEGGYNRITRELGTYDGTLYLLVNRDTGSAGETAVL